MSNLFLSGFNADDDLNPDVLGAFQLQGTPTTCPGIDGLHHTSPKGISPAPCRICSRTPNIISEREDPDQHSR
jgi:hypothetical protein